MNALERQVTSNNTDANVVAAMGIVCLGLATVLPEVWNLTALIAGLVSLFSAHWLRKQDDAQAEDYFDRT